MEHSWLQNVLCGTDTEHPPHRRAHLGYQVHFYYQVSSNPTAAAAASPEPWEDHSMLSRAEVIRKNKAVSLCRLQLLSWKNGTFFFPLLGVLNSFPEKQGPAAEGEAELRLEVFRCWFSPRSHNLHLESSTDQSIPRQIFEQNHGIWKVCVWKFWTFCWVKCTWACSHPPGCDPHLSLGSETLGKNALGEENLNFLTCEKVKFRAAHLFSSHYLRLCVYLQCLLSKILCLACSLEQYQKEMGVFWQ